MRKFKLAHLGVLVQCSSQWCLQTVSEVHSISKVRYNLINLVTRLLIKMRTAEQSCKLYCEHLNFNAVGV